jgi:hypothetical protein
MGASERDIVGKVRGMTAEGVQKKFDVATYVHMHPVRMLGAGPGASIGASPRLRPIASSSASAVAAAAASGDVGSDDDDVIGELLASQHALASESAAGDAAAADVDVDDLF